RQRYQVSSGSSTSTRARVLIGLFRFYASARATKFHGIPTRAYCTSVIPARVAAAYEESRVRMVTTLTVEPGPTSAATAIWPHETLCPRYGPRSVEQLVEKVQEMLPEISDDRFYSAICGWCEFEVLARRAYRVLNELGIANEQGDARRLLGDFRQI